MHGDMEKVSIYRSTDPWSIHGLPERGFHLPILPGRHAKKIVAFLRRWLGDAQPSEPLHFSTKSRVCPLLGGRLDPMSCGRLPAEAADVDRVVAAVERVVAGRSIQQSRNRWVSAL